MDRFDAVLVGGGIMSATLGTLLKHVEPSWKIAIIERLPAIGEESSNAWNNAGTGHSALCELNYTPQKDDGSIAIDSAVSVNEQFQAGQSAMGSSRASHWGTRRLPAIGYGPTTWPTRCTRSARAVNPLTTWWHQESRQPSMRSPPSPANSLALRPMKSSHTNLDCAVHWKSSPCD